MKTVIKIRQLAGSFAENKDIAKKIREEEIMPTLSMRKEIIIDFKEVTGATQSFIHALISDPIRKYKDVAFNNLIYKNANDDIQQIITIVYRYLQESFENE